MKIAISFTAKEVAYFNKISTKFDGEHLETYEDKTKAAATSALFFMIMALMMSP